MWRYFKDSAIVSRTTYIDNKSSGVTPTGNIYKGYLKPLKPDDSLYQGAFGKDFSFTTDKNANIQEADVLTIEGVNYKVKAIAGWDGIVVKYKRLLLVKT